MMYCEWPLGMIHFSLKIHHNMGMKYAEDPFNMGMFYIPKASFKMGTFSDLQDTHPGILYIGVAPWEAGAVIWGGVHDVG